MTNLQYTSVIYPADLKPRIFTLEEVYSAVAYYTGINNFSVKSQKKDVVYCRHLFAVIARKKTLSSHKEIAKVISWDKEKPKNHATVIHSVNTLQDWIDTDEKVREDVRSIMNILKEKE